MQGSQGDAPAPVVPVERDLCVTLLHETTWHRCVDFVSKNPQPWVPAQVGTTVVQKVSGDGNPSPSPPLDSGPRLHEGRLFAGMTVVRRAACPVVPPSLIIPITKSHESQFRRSDETPLGSYPRPGFLWTIAAHPCYHGRRSTRCEAPRAPSCLPHQSSPSPNHTNHSSDVPRCSTPGTSRGIPPVPFCGKRSHRPDRNGTLWNGMEHLTRNRPPPRPNYSLTRPPQLPMGSVTEPNSRRSRALASADKGPLSTDSTFCCRWTGSMVPVMTVETPSV